MWVSGASVLCCMCWLFFCCLSAPSIPLYILVCVDWNSANITFQVSLPDGFLLGFSSGRIGRRWKGGRRGNRTFFLISALTSIFPRAKNSGSFGFQLLLALPAPGTSCTTPQKFQYQPAMPLSEDWSHHQRLGVSLRCPHTSPWSPAGSLSSSQVGFLKP